MAELTVFSDIQQTFYPEEVISQLHVMAQAGESSPVKDQRSNHCATPPTTFYVITSMKPRPEAHFGIF